MKNEHAPDLTLRPAQETISSTPVRLVERSLAAGTLYAGGLGAMCTAFGWVPRWAAMAVGLVALCAAVWCAMGRGWRQWLPAMAALVAAAWCLLVPQARDSAAGLLNGPLLWLQQLTGHIQLPLTCQQSSAAWAAVPACVVLGGLLGSLSVYAPAAGPVLAVLCVVPSAVSGQAASLWMGLLWLGAALVWLGGRRSCRTIPAVSLHTAVLLLVIAAAAAGTVLLSNLTSVVETEDAATALRQSVHHLLYEDGAQPMPEGSLTGEAPDFTDTEMLCVTLSQPESLYLRGFIGQRYTRTGWEALSTGELAEQANDVSWLQNGGFFGLTQLNTLTQLLHVDTPRLQVQIDVSGACRRSAILPYELADNALCDPDQLRDTLPGGSRSYTFTAAGNLTARAYELLELLSQRLEEPDMQTYLAQESVYRRQVYQNYLTIPEDTQRVLKAFLGTAPESITSYEAKARILACLNETVSYDEAAAELPEDADPVSSFLQESGRGSAVQYATAAVMMLRYYGIPARYVEGYLITPQMTDGLSGETTLTLTGNDAHAWAEYYEDGVGWIPFETTPPYQGLMAESDWRWFQPDDESQLTGAQNQEGDSGQNKTIRHSTVETLEDTTSQPEIITIWNRLTASIGSTLSAVHAERWAMALLLLLLLAAVVTVLLRHRAVRRRRQTAFDDPDAACATAALFAYAMELMWRSGLPRENRSLLTMEQVVSDWAGETVDFAPLAWLNAEARYSRHPISETQRGQMRQFADDTLHRFRRRLKLWQRFWQKWIRCIY